MIIYAANLWSLSFALQYQIDIMRAICTVNDGQVLSHYVGCVHARSSPICVP